VERCAGSREENASKQNLEPHSDSIGMGKARANMKKIVAFPVAAIATAPASCGPASGLPLRGTMKSEVGSGGHDGRRRGHRTKNRPKIFRNWFTVLKVWSKVLNSLECIMLGGSE
jgi:hypothetical protein